MADRRFSWLGSAMAGLVLVLAMIVGAVATGSVSAQGRTMISGQVLDQGIGVPDVVIDVFLDGRSSWQGSVTTDVDGVFAVDPARFGWAPGECLVLTAIAPAGQVFVGGSRWADATACPLGGDVIDGIEFVLRGPEPVATVGGAVGDDAGPLEGLQIDAFVAGADGSRSEWLVSTDTGADGRFAFELEAGCYILTYIAPEGTGFTGSGSRWLNRPVCVDPGETVELSPVTVAGGGRAAITISATEDGAGVEGVVVDLFRQTGAYLGSRSTDGSGRVEFPVDVGCYRLVVIAPVGQYHAASRDRYDERQTCAAAGQTVQLDPADLDRPPLLVRFGFYHRQLPVSNRVVEVWSADRAGNLGELLAQGSTGPTGSPASVFVFDWTPCWVVRAVLPEGETFASTGTDTRLEPSCADDHDWGDPVGRLTLRYDDEVIAPPDDDILDLGSILPLEVTQVEGFLDGRPHFYALQADPGALIDVVNPTGCEAYDDFAVYAYGSDEVYLRQVGEASSDFCRPIGQVEVPADGVLLLAIGVEGSQTAAYRFEVLLAGQLAAATAVVEPDIHRRG